MAVLRFVLVVVVVLSGMLFSVEAAMAQPQRQVILDNPNLIAMPNSCEFTYIAMDPPYIGSSAFIAVDAQCAHGWIAIQVEIDGVMAGVVDPETTGCFNWYCFEWNLQGYAAGTHTITLYVNDYFAGTHTGPNGEEASFVDIGEPVSFSFQYVLTGAEVEESQPGRMSPCEVDTIRVFPENSAPVGTLVGITAEVWCENPMSQVTIDFDGLFQDYMPDSQSMYLWDTTGWNPGGYMIYIRVVDIYGNWNYGEIWYDLTAGEEMIAPHPEYQGDYEGCEGAIAKQMVVGQLGWVPYDEEVSIQDYTSIRNEPQGGEVVKVYEGETFLVIGGPVCTEARQGHLNWWQVQYGNTIGWMPEGYIGEKPWIEPYYAVAEVAEIPEIFPGATYYAPGEYPNSEKVSADFINLTGIQMRDAGMFVVSAASMDGLKGLGCVVADGMTLLGDPLSLGEGLEAMDWICFVVDAYGAIQGSPISGPYFFMATILSHPEKYIDPWLDPVNEFAWSMPMTRFVCGLSYITCPGEW